MNNPMTAPSSSSVQWQHHPKADTTVPYGDNLKEIISRKAFSDAMEVIRHWPGYSQTTLQSLDTLGKESNLGALWYKDESTRFELRSFKGLGGAYAVYRLLARKISESTGETDIKPEAILAGKYNDIISKITVTCATDGNHGRSVAWGAQRFGCQCVIYVHQLVSKGREEAIAAFGAEVIRTDGNYDDSVRQAQEDAEKYGRFVISDTSYPGYMEVPKDVMQGYTVMVEEALAQLPNGQVPTHTFLQGGVGGLAGAVAAHLWETLGEQCPRIIIVEPEKADCLYRSAVAGEPVTVHGDLDTIMAGLACGEVSLLAWEILDRSVSDFITIPDNMALDCMRLLAKSNIVAGESAVAGLAACLYAAKDSKLRDALGLDENSRVLFFGTEGDTDPELYQEIVGKTADEVRG